jgi:hypothetical protein
MSSTHPSENTIASLQTILDAIKTGNYELFLTVGDSGYKTGISKETGASMPEGRVDRSRTRADGRQAPTDVGLRCPDPRRE